MVSYITYGLESIPYDKPLLPVHKIAFWAFLTRKCCLGSVPYKNMIFFMQGSNSFNHYMEIGIHPTQTTIELK